MRIDLTGTNGFIIKYLYKYLTNNPNYIINKLDLRDAITLEQNLFSDVCVHLAGIAHDTNNTHTKNLYYDINTTLTHNLFNKFLNSDCKVFIFISSVKSVIDKIDSILDENEIPNPKTDYGKSKLLAEQYILSKFIPIGKKVFILRPSMIHGPGNKGNLNLLYKIVCKGLPWPLGAFDNKRSFCSIDNLCFIINELIQNENIPSGIYNIADDEPLSTNELIKLIAKSMNKKASILNIPKFLVRGISKLGDVFNLPLNTERLDKLTETFVVSNQKIKIAINKPLPVTSRYGLIKTFESFRNNNTH